MAGEPYPQKGILNIFVPPALPDSYQFSSTCRSVSLSVRPSICNAVFSGLAHYFWYFEWRLGSINTKKWRSAFLRKICFAQNWLFWASVSALMNFSVNVFIRFFKGWLILGPKSLFLNFCLRLFIRFSWNVTWFQALKSGQKW